MVIKDLEVVDDNIFQDGKVRMSITAPKDTPSLSVYSNNNIWWFGNKPLLYLARNESARPGLAAFMNIIKFKAEYYFK